MKLLETGVVIVVANIHVKTQATFVCKKYFIVRFSFYEDDDDLSFYQHLVALVDKV